MKFIDEVNIKNKTVILRVDYNVPIKDNKIDDDFRITSSLETINYLINNNCKIIILSHLGRVKTVDDKNKNSLRLVYNRLKELVNVNVDFCEDLKGKTLEENVKKLKSKEILLLENTRFMDLEDNKESNCDLELSKYWASLGEVFVNDAFGTTHRKHASTYGITKFLPTCYGFLIKKEIRVLNEALKVNDKILILGGAKVDDKLKLIKNLIDSSSKLLLGGKMCFTFLKAKGNIIDKSLVNEEELNNVKLVYKENVNKIILPVDVIDNLDIGIKTIELFKNSIDKNKLVVWNGPLGYIEDPKYKTGTLEILKYLEDNKIKTIIAGGDTAKIANNEKFKFYHTSTGGGATLEYLQGKNLPALEGEWY